MTLAVKIPRDHLTDSTGIEGQGSLRAVSVPLCFNLVLSVPFTSI